MKCKLFSLCNSATITKRLAEIEIRYYLRQQGSKGEVAAVWSCGLPRASRPQRSRNAWPLLGPMYFDRPQKNSASLTDSGPNWVTEHFPTDGQGQGQCMPAGMSLEERPLGRAGWWCCSYLVLRLQHSTERFIYRPMYASEQRPLIHRSCDGHGPACEACISPPAYLDINLRLHVLLTCPAKTVVCTGMTGYPNRPTRLCGGSAGLEGWKATGTPGTPGAAEEATAGACGRPAKWPGRVIWQEIAEGKACATGIPRGPAGVQNKRLPFLPKPRSPSSSPFQTMPPLHLTVITQAAEPLARWLLDSLPLWSRAILI